MMFMFDAVVEVRCGVCSQMHNVAVREVDFNTWQGGKLIQNAMPYLSADERELLISGTCGKCFDDMFGGDDE